MIINEKKIIFAIFLYQGTYNDEVIKRLLVLKKLDGYPVIREVLEEEKEEEMTTMDIREIQNMAEELDVDQECFFSRDLNLPKIFENNFQLKKLLKISG